MNYIQFVTIALELCAVALAAPTEDLITDPLPGNIQFRVKFKQYSGYLNSAETHHLFYWFVESQSDPANDPVVLWLNGGPGCSSLDGLLSELGPFRAAEYGNKLTENQYAWDKQANVIFLEAPVGVGFSYAEEGYANMTWDDDKTARENHNALVSFFSEKFPEYRKNDFFVTGESYAGIYIPTLAVLLSKDKGNFPNFKGIAIGDGSLDYPLSVNTLVPYNYYHALYSEQLWQNISSQCCNGDPNNCDFFAHLITPTPTACKTMVDNAYNAANFYFDPFFIYFDCYLSDATKQHDSSVYRNQKDVTSSQTPIHWLRANAVGDAYYSSYMYFDPYFIYFMCYLDDTGKDRPVVVDDPVKMVDVGQGSPIQWLRQAAASRAHISDAPAPACAHHNDSAYYMVREDVRHVLHVRNESLPWSSCSDQIANDYNQIYLNVSEQIQTVIDASVRVLIYNGDVDTVCNGIANGRFVQQLGRPLIGQPHQAWEYEFGLPSTAGFVSRYEGIDFVVLHGAGHFVPSEKPREALQMITNFLRNTGNYSLPTGINVNLNTDANYCDQSYVVNQWLTTTPQQMCGKGNMCVSGVNGPQCFCFNRQHGQFCNDMNSTTSISDSHS